MHSSLAKTLFLTGARFRNPSLFTEYERVKDSERFSRVQLQQLQLERASRFLQFAERHSPYYRRLFDTHGFSARRFSAVEDLEILPTVGKDELIRENDHIHTEYEFSKCFLAETSGTTGSALEFRKNERWDSINRALMMRGYDWHGVECAGLTALPNDIVLLNQWRFGGAIFLI